MPLKSLEYIIEAVFLTVLASVNLVGPIKRGEPLTIRDKLGLVLLVLIIAHTGWRCIWP